MARAAWMVFPVIFSGTVLACVSSVGPRAEAWHGSDPTTWALAGRRLESYRETQPRGSWAAAIRVRMREPRSGRDIYGRGAMAVAREGLRMILVGAAGMTMLDAWVTPERWRIVVPPLGVSRRGGHSAPDDLPVAFLRYTFFRPLAGRLFAASVQHDGMTLLLREGNAVIEVRQRRCDRGALTSTTRRIAEHVECVEECKAMAVPTPGDWVAYHDERSGLRVDLTIESMAATRPEQQAFEDPDGPSGAP